MSIIVDGVDLEGLGVLLVEDAQGQHDGFDVDQPIAHVPGKYGGVFLGVIGQSRERRVTVVGGLRSDTHAEVLTALDDLRWRIEERNVQVAFTDRTSRYFNGRLESVKHPGVPPAHTQRMSHFSWTFLCADPRYFESTPTVVTFTSSAASTPLGNAKVWPVISIVGAVTDPIVIYRNSLGVEMWRMAFVGSVGGGQELLIDFASQSITLDGADAYNLLDGLVSRLGPLDFRDATSLTGAQPTLEISPTPTSATATYNKAWR